MGEAYGEPAGLKPRLRLAKNPNFLGTWMDQHSRKNGEMGGSIVMGEAKIDGLQGEIPI